MANNNDGLNKDKTDKLVAFQYTIGRIKKVPSFSRSSRAAAASTVAISSSSTR